MKIIIVEDERVIREGLAKLLSQTEGVEVLAQCVSARDGHAQIRALRPDAVITDIVMGSESGLDMIQWCREDGLKCEFVLVSGYSEFEYARRALQLSVFDYLNKPLNFAKMEDIVRRLQVKLADEKRIVDRSVDALAGSASPEDGAKPDLLESGDLYVVAANVYRRNDGENDLGFGRECCEQVAQKCLRGYCRHIEKFGMHFELVSGKNERDAFVSGLLSLVKSRSLKLGLDIRLGVGGRFQDIAQIAQGIAQAMAAAQSCAFQQKNVAQADLLPYPVAENPEPLFMREFLKIREALQPLDAEAVCRAVYGAADALEEIVPPYAVFAFYNRCAREISWNASEEKGAYVTDQQSSRLLSAPTAQVLRERFFAVAREQVELVRARSGSDDALGRAIAYIQIHYAEAIRASDVAQMFFIDPVYFSKQFKKRMGENYNDYVTGLRMDRAERLLRLGNYSIAEVAGMVGYQSQRHFSSLFKARKGRYPSDARDQ